MRSYDVRNREPDRKEGKKEERDQRPEQVIFYIQIPRQDRIDINITLTESNNNDLQRVYITFLDPSLLSDSTDTFLVNRVTCACET